MIFQSLRAPRPDSVPAVAPYINFVSEPHPPGYYVASGSRNTTWSPYCDNGWFAASGKLVGRAAKLDKAPHKFSTGRLDERFIGKLTIGDVSFGYEVDDELVASAPSKRLAIVSAGVLHYLQGYDRQASDDIFQRVKAAEDAEEANLTAVVGHFVNGPGLEEMNETLYGSN